MVSVNDLGYSSAVAIPRWWLRYPGTVSRKQHSRWSRPYRPPRGRRRPRGRYPQLMRTGRRHLQEVPVPASGSYLRIAPQPRSGPPSELGRSVSNGQSMCNAKVLTARLEVLQRWESVGHGRVVIGLRIKKQKLRDCLKSREGLKFGRRWQSVRCAMFRGLES
jgi:hypothetical protein